MAVVFQYILLSLPTMLRDFWSRVVAATIIQLTTVISTHDLLFSLGAVAEYLQIESSLELDALC